MSFDYSSAPTEQMGDFGLLPNGVLAKAVLTIKPGPVAIETQSKGNNENWFLDLTLTITEGPYARRKIFTRLGVRGSDEYVNQGRAAIRAILEYSRGASASNPAAYQIASFADLDASAVAVKVKIQKGNNGYQDKNDVAAWLTPNPDSQTYKDFQKLVSGVESVANASTAPAQQQKQAPANTKPSWL